MFVDGLRTQLPTRPEVLNFIKRKNVDSPLNDLGVNREIKFEAYDFLWVIKFENSYESNILGEEFCALLQILLVELKTHFRELVFEKSIKEVQINLTESERPAPPERLEVINTTIKWKFLLPKIQKPKPFYPVVLSAIISVMRELVEEDVDLSEIFEKLLKEQDFGSKIPVVQPYDKLYKSLFSVENYDSLMRTGFSDVAFEESFVKSNDLIAHKP